nr:VRR-NUC domain-containing protein [Pseudomonas sp. R5(2019)]
MNNFQRVLDWLGQRYADVLSIQERGFIGGFSQTDKSSRALLVRMVMRKGPLYRASKLRYEEIGATREAVLPLLAKGWVDRQAPLDISQLCEVLLKAELVECFKPHIPNPRLSKAECVEALLAVFTECMPFEQWCPQVDDQVYSLPIRELCDRLRLLFFGNFRQDWSEFVLADLGLLRYESVDFSADSRALRSRADIDTYEQLYACQRAFEAGVPVGELLATLPARQVDNPWLEGRRARLQFRLGQHCERLAEWSLALALYTECIHAEARVRQIRVLERCERFAQALALAEQAQLAPRNAAETQQLLRIVPRLRRKLGLPAVAAARAPQVQRLDLQLPHDGALESVEHKVRQYLSEDQAPVHYVENTLINSLFGLLCWPAIFAPVPGAFFHPFQSGPADLLHGEFRERRAELFAKCLAQLDDERYKATIRQHYESKYGLQSPFVYWGVLDETVLEQALECLPAEHLKHWFERLLEDIQANRAGMPDLIQFWPEEKRYRMIEVKGPGDRLQDNQLRWLAFCARHQMPVAVCYVQWAEQGA